MCPPSYQVHHLQQSWKGRHHPSWKRTVRCQRTPIIRCEVYTVPLKLQYEVYTVPLKFQYEVSRYKEIIAKSKHGLYRFRLIVRLAFSLASYIVLLDDTWIVSRTKQPDFFYWCESLGIARSLFLVGHRLGGLLQHFGLDIWWKRLNLTYIICMY